MVVSDLLVRGGTDVRGWWCPRIAGGDQTHGVLVVLLVVEVVVVADVGPWCSR